MIMRTIAAGVLLSVLSTLTGLAAPVIDPIANVTIPAGKSMIIPITASSSSGTRLSYSIKSSSPAIDVVMHTNNPFWQLTVAQAAATNAAGAYLTPFRGGLVSVTNVGTMTFELFPEYAPHTVNIIDGLTQSGFYNSNTIFHRVISNFIIQGGDPETNGLGGLVFEYNDEFNPEAIFSGHGQLALANSGPNTDGSQFFVTMAPYRSGDFNYAIFGQLVRGFPVLTNLNDTTVNTNDRPEANEIIQTAEYVTNLTDTVLTLTAAKTATAYINATITVIATDGNGGRATNVFKATTAKDTNSDNMAFFYPPPKNMMLGKENTIVEYPVKANELDGDPLYWNPQFVNEASYEAASGSGYSLGTSTLDLLTYKVSDADGTFNFFIKTSTNYVGPVALALNVSADEVDKFYWEYGFTPPADTYTYNFFTVVFGDTAILAKSNTVEALATVPFTNLTLATFTNGVPFSSYTNFSASIYWGDNVTNSGTITTNSAGLKAVLGSHTYQWPGDYLVYVTIQSGIGFSTSIISSVVVTNAAIPATNLLTVSITGNGAVSPLYVGAPLAVGETYTLAGSPSNTAILATWTDQNGFVLGTGTNLTFTMTPNLALTANFVPIAPPSTLIQYPANNQVITNLYSSTVSVTGVAWDNTTVTSVWCQVNSSGWFEAAGSNNWTATFSPPYGAVSEFQVYAVNNLGYHSPTNTQQVKYLAGDYVTITTNGVGKIVPQLDGELLPLGSNYTITVTPSAGFVFSSWSGSASTNHAALKFTMATNLTFTANLRDTTVPVVSLTNLKPRQQVSNSVFVVNGNTTFNWIVTNVYYRVNGGAWSNAVGTTEWAASLNLVPGTNVLAVYAVGVNGSVSPTLTTAFRYIVSGELTVDVNHSGWGTVSPNLNGATVAIGAAVTLTAKPSAGFAFSNWTSNSAVVTDSATLHFTMASNLVYTANFADISKPTVAITNVPAGLTVTNASFVLKGKASDNVSVASVWYQVNGGGWLKATEGSSWDNWSASVSLVSGVNTLEAQSEDSSGNYSAIVSAKVKLNFVAEGLWNVVQLSTPTLLAWDLTNGLSGGDYFYATNGTFTVNANSTISGQIGQPFTGSIDFVTAGLADATVVTGTNTNYYALTINAGQDTMTAASVESADFTQSLLIFQRAPATGSLSAYAGAWTAFEFKTPAALTAVGGDLMGGGFSVTNGALTVSSNGAVTTAVDSSLQGTLSVGADGAVTLTSATNTDVFYANASLSTLVSEQSRGEDTLVVMERAPKAANANAVAGTWNGVGLFTPAQLSLSLGSGLTGGTNFVAGNSTLTLYANGALIGDFGGSYYGGSYTVTAGGVVSGVLTNSAVPSLPITLYVNSTLDTMTSVQSTFTTTNNLQGIYVFLRPGN